MVPKRAPFRGFTLIEILVALTLTLILMTALVRVFAGVGDGISKSRRALEQFDRLRTAAQQLDMDMKGITARLDGRAGRPEEALGYFELIEGSYLFRLPGSNPPCYGMQTVNGTSKPDYTVGQRGDILMFTTRNPARPFVGRFGYDAKGNPQTVQSDVAEVCWFLRGNRLHRRVLLIVPGAAVANYSRTAFYNDYDLSVHIANGKIAPNSLADLVKRENRFAHDASKFPFDVRGWLGYCLPTLAECSSTIWMAGWVNGSTPPPPTAGPSVRVDMWDTSPTSPVNQLDQAPAGSQRVSDDVVLTNVIGFDVKVWEPAANGGAGGYVDLGSTETGAQGGPVALSSFATPQGPTSYRFNNGGITESGLSGSGTTPRVYDSDCFSYENEGIYHFDKNGNPVVDTPGGRSTNGIDDDGDGIVDDKTEQLTSPPYPVPLRGIQIKIRCFEPESKQIREITLEHDFLPK